MSDEKPRASHRDFEEFILWLRELRRKGRFLTMQFTMQAGEVYDVKPTPIVKPHEKLPEL